MILAVLLTAVTLPAFMYATHRFEQWSHARETRAAERRAARQAARARDLIANHQGASDEFASELQAWKKSGLGSAVAR